jgi:nucleoside-diphosphate-sugar epimerase
MRVFVTGASGWIGSAVVPELLSAGHQVVGLARTDASAEAVAAAGAEVQRGSLDDLDSLRAGAEKSDGVIHLAFVHDFSAMEAAAATDLRAIETFGDELEGSDRPLVIASGALGMAPGRVATERDQQGHAAPRTLNERAALALAAQGVRSSSVRLAPSVHGEGDHGFIATLAGIARERGVSGYIGDGTNRWPAVHRSDIARLYRLAVEQAPAGSVLHGIAEEGVPVRSIAEVIGRKLDLPVVSVDPDDAADHFSWLGRFLAFDSPVSSSLTRDLLGWTPTGPTLLEDLEAGYYTK